MTKKRIKKLIRAFVTKRYLASEKFIFGDENIGKAYKQIRNIGFENANAVGSYEDVYSLFIRIFQQ